MHSMCLCNCACMSVCTCAFTQVCAHTMMHFVHVLCSASHIPVLACSSAPAMATSSSPPAMATGGGFAPQQRLPAEQVLKVPFCTANLFGDPGWNVLQQEVRSEFAVTTVKIRARESGQREHIRQGGRAQPFLTLVGPECRAAYVAFMKKHSVSTLCQTRLPVRRSWGWAARRMRQGLGATLGSRPAAALE